MKNFFKYIFNIGYDKSEILEDGRKILYFLGIKFRIKAKEAHSKINYNYSIIPFGNYCFPRFITATNRLKPLNSDGEKTYPFDICTSNFYINAQLLKTKFNEFYDDLVYDKKSKIWKSQKYDMTFPHDRKLKIKEFKNRYNRRIQNLYDILNDESKHLYFLIATTSPIVEEEFLFLLEVFNEYRKNGDFTVIILNQSSEEFNTSIKNVEIVNLCNNEDYKKLFKDSGWVYALKSLKTQEAINYYREISRHLFNIIR